MEPIAAADTAPQQDVGPVVGSRRILVFRVAVAVVVIGLLAGPGGLADLFAAVTVSHLQLPHAELHRWHSIELAALVSLLVVGMLLIALREPRAVVVVRTVVVSLLVFASFSMTTPASAEVLLPVAAVIVVVVATYPGRRALLRFPPLRLRHPAALLAAAVPTPFLFLNAWDHVGLQVGGTDPHALLGHWAGAAALSAVLLLTGWTAATDQPGSRALALLVAIVFVYLGVSGIALDGHDGAWGPLGVGSGLLAALLFAASFWRSPRGSAAG